jgi:hypothetical protein
MGQRLRVPDPPLDPAWSLMSVGGPIDGQPLAGRSQCPADQWVILGPRRNLKIGCRLVPALTCSEGVNTGDDQQVARRG